MHRQTWKKRSFLAVFIVICVAAGILFNGVMDLLSDQYNLTVDMTENGIYQLSEQTMQVLSNIREPVSIFVLMKEADFSTKNFYAQVNELLQQYKIAGNGAITLKYVDVYSDPSFLSQYQDMNLSSGSLIVQRGDRHKGLSMNDLYQIQYDPSTGQPFIQGIDAEQVITSAVLSVSSEETRAVLFLQGHGEQYSNLLPVLFGNSGFETGFVNLAADVIPADTAMLIMSGPTIDYTNQELEKMDEYLSKGGKLLFMASVYAGETPELNRFFESWGVSVGRSVIMDQQYSLPNNPMQIYGALAGGQIAENLQSRSEMPLLVPGCRPLSVVGRERTGWRVEPLVYSSAAAYERPLSEMGSDSNQTQEEQNSRGPFILAAAAQHDLSDGSRGCILFIGTHLISSDSLLSEPSWLNSSFLTQCINYLDGQESIVTVTPKQMTTPQLVMSNTVAKIIFWADVVFLPLAILAAGGYVWRKRRVR